MLTKVGQFINEKNLIRDSDRVLCMVSGGADSTAMFHILNELTSGEYRSFAGSFTLGICHVNYGRRGQASEEDESFVRQMGDRAQVPVHVVQAPREERSNFQAWARDFRYLAAHNLCRWQGYTRIAVAHNKDDRIETFLYRLMTYSGRRSIVVMPPLKGRIIRPLLFATSSEIRDFCGETGLSYRDDETNRSPGYTRNRIRHDVIPQLQQIKPDFRERISDTLSQLEDENKVLESVTEDFWRRAVEESEEGGATLKVCQIAQMPRATARLVLRRWLSGTRSRVRLSQRLLDSVISLCRDQNGTSNISLSDGLQVERRYGKLMLVANRHDKRNAGRETAGTDPGRGQEHGPAAEKGKREAVLDIPGRAAFGRFEIEAVESPPWELLGSDPLRVILDRDPLSGPLTVRSWRPGDRFTPLGLGGSKSIQDLFTDEKVPRPERENIPIVVCGDRIVWVCGLRISDEFRVTGSSRNLIGLKATRRAVERAV